jgi:hypothetical protein
VVGEFSWSSFDNQWVRGEAVRDDGLLLELSFVVCYIASPLFYPSMGSSFEL